AAAGAGGGGGGGRGDAAGRDPQPTGGGGPRWVPRGPSRGGGGPGGGGGQRPPPRGPAPPPPGCRPARPRTPPPPRPCPPRGGARRHNQRGRVIGKQRADPTPAAAELQQALARSHYNIGIALRNAGRTEEAVATSRTAVAIRQQLADANPAVTKFQSDLAMS